MSSGYFESYYNENIIKQMSKDFAYNNILEVPKIEKIVISISVGTKDNKLLDYACQVLERITGQKPIKTKARKSIAAFALREGMHVGCKVTLRKAKMYNFLEKLVYVALPRIRDFRGLNKNSVNKAVFNFGIEDHMVFPEIEYDSVYKNVGMDISIVTNSKNSKELIALLKKFNMPIN